MWMRWPESGETLELTEATSLVDSAFTVLDLPRDLVLPVVTSDAVEFEAEMVEKVCPPPEVEAPFLV